VAAGDCTGRLAVVYAHSTNSTALNGLGWAMSTDVPPLDDQDLPVGALLARMRKRMGLSGLGLAQRVGVSQAKISRIETGAILPDPTDIAQIARGLGAAEIEVQALVDRAERAYDQMTDSRPRSPASSIEDDKRHLEAAAEVICDFQPAVVPDLLQTSEYARAVYSAQVRSDKTLRAVSVGVSVRMRRQEILADSAKRFRFVLTEGALRHPVCPGEEMLAQLSRIRALSEQPNINIGIVPDGVAAAFPALHGFTIFDDRVVTVELFTTTVVSSGRGDVTAYQEVFDDWDSHADSDAALLIDRYRNIYLQQLFSDPGPPAGRGTGSW
jgi:transcriptional regulator with XRE-family HTH domain